MELWLYPPAPPPSFAIMAGYKVTKKKLRNIPSTPLIILTFDAMYTNSPRR